MRSFLIAAAALLWIGRAQAQSVNTQTFRPAIGPENVITVEGTRTPGHLEPIFYLMGEYAYHPLRLQAGNGSIVANTITDMVTVHMMGGLGITRYLSLAADIPLVPYQRFDSATPPGLAATPPSAPGLGDIRLVGKARFLINDDGGFGIAFVPQVTLPVGSTPANTYRSDDAFGFEPRLALDYRTRGRFFVALNGSFLLRTSDQELLNVRVSHQVRYGLGMFVPIGAGLGLAGEVVGGTSIDNKRDTYSYLEGYAAARWRHRSGFQFDVGGGGAFLTAVGSPQFRIFGGIGYLPMGRPAKVELDRDGDGLLDKDDRCPDEPGPRENGGCPDRDRDGDGIVDRLDKCPDQPEDKDGFEDQDGCPDPDNDKDGVLDAEDRCPNEPGPRENGGCPDHDRDGDGIVDRLDKCPDQPGIPPDGCPARKYIILTDEKIELREQIHFATNKAEIRPDSFDLLDEVVDVLKKHETLRLRIEGHTDSRGTLKWNMKLSRERAAAVRDYLVQKGTEESRLSSDGFGPTRPIADNGSAEGREKNRRTEFFIVK